MESVLHAYLTSGPDAWNQGAWESLGSVRPRDRAYWILRNAWERIGGLP